MNTELGKRLSKAREARGLSIEEAAHATRMRPSHVRALEDGNLSKFPNAAYAKGFLTMYARFLNVDVKDVTRTIDTSTQMSVSDFQYLTNRSKEDRERKREAEDVRYNFVVPEKDKSWVPLFVLGGIGLAGLVAFTIWTNMSRIAPPEAPADVQPGVAAAPEPEPEKKPAAAPAPSPEPAPAIAGAEAPAPGEDEIPRPRVISVPEGAVPAALAVERAALAPAPQPEPEIPRAKPVSPVAQMAVDDAAALAELGAAGTRPGPQNGIISESPAVPEVEEENSPLAADPRTIVLEPLRKAWVVIRTGPGGQPLYEDFLYPSAKPMRLPAGRYFIELREADSVEISRNGRRIAYSAPGVLVE